MKEVEVKLDKDYQASDAGAKGLILRFGRYGGDYVQIKVDWELAESFFKQLDTCMKSFVDAISDQNKAVEKLKKIAQTGILTSKEDEDDDV